MKSFVITKLLIALILSGAYFTNLSAQCIISTYAGNGNNGYTGDGGSATAAEIGGPLGICVDHANNIYFIDNYHFLIRKVDAVTNIITTVAGGGTGGMYSGEGGPATAANIGYCSFLCLDPGGNIIFTTQTTIGKIDLSGIYTIIAGTPLSGGYTAGDGGPATAALFNVSGGVVSDNAGNIYIAQNYCVRKISAATGIVNCIAGNGVLSGYSGDGGPATAALFNNIASICLDTSGNILVADQFNGLVRKIDIATGIVTRIAGTPGGGLFSGDNGPALSACIGAVSGLCCDKHGNIYMNGFHYSSKINMGTGIINLIAGNLNYGYSGDGGIATMGSMAYPLGIGIDSSGENIFIADHDNSRIRKVTNVGVLSVTQPENSAIDEPTIYPNPTNGNVSIRVTDAMKYAQASVFNVSGIVVFEAVLKDNETIIDLSAQPTGIYFISVKSAHGNYIKQITVSK